MAFHFIESTDRRALARELADRIGAAPLPDPLQPEIIVVPGVGIATWLRLELARHNGIFANVEMPYPRAFVRQLVAGESDEDPWSQGAMALHIATCLHQRRGEAEFSAIDTYLGDEATTARRLLPLARRLASTFDDYFARATGELTEWLQGREVEGWQEVLIADLRAQIEEPPLVEQIGAWLEAGGGASSTFDRVSFFLLQGMPPAYYEVFRALAESREVVVYHASAAAHADHPHPLLHSMGRLAESTREDWQPASVTSLPATYSTSSLGALQSDVEQGTRRAPLKGAQAPTKGRPDRSIQFHSCHGKLREVEVLYDQLLALFDESDDNPDRLDKLTAGDVLVVAPDIHAYAPYIEAVFGASPPSGSKSKLEYAIVGRTLRDGGAAATTVDALLRQVVQRSRLSGLLDLFSRPSIRRRFDVSADALPDLRDLLHMAGARWGIDEQERVEEGQPPDRTHTIGFAVDRLLTGYMMEGGAAWEGVLPAQAPAAETAAALGGFASFCRAYAEVRKVLRTPATLSEWKDRLDAAMERLFVPAESRDWSFARLAEVLDEMTSVAGERLDALIAVQAFRSALQDELSSKRLVGRLWNRGVQFTDLSLARGIPFRVVVMLGMSDGAFPSRDVEVAYDALSDERAKAPWNRLAQDRAAFLETVMSARERLLIFYEGQNIQKDGDEPASVVVHELLDTLVESYADVPSDEELILRHGLQPFSVRYFDPSQPEFFTYAASYAAGAQQVNAAKKPAALPFDAPLPEPAADSAITGSVDIEDLVSFFKDPARAFLRHRLQATLLSVEDALDEQQPLGFGDLEAWALGQRLVDGLVAGEKLETMLDRMRLEGTLPPGQLADGPLSSVIHCATVVDVGAQLAIEQLGGTPRVLDVDTALVHGRIKNVYDGGPLIAEYGTTNGARVLTAWIRHLCWASAEPANEGRTILVARKADNKKTPRSESVAFELTGEEKTHLADLVDVYRLGMRNPLPFHAKAAWEYMAGGADKQEADRVAAASGVYDKEYGTSDLHKRFFGAGEFASFYEQRVRTGDAEAPIVSFQYLAERVIGPALEAMNHE